MLLIFRFKQLFAKLNQLKNQELTWSDHHHGTTKPQVQQSESIDLSDPYVAGAAHFVI
jgi:hypothetical protein